MIVFVTAACTECDPCRYNYVGILHAIKGIVCYGPINPEILSNFVVNTTFWSLANILCTTDLNNLGETSCTTGHATVELDDRVLFRFVSNERINCRYLLENTAVVFNP